MTPALLFVLSTTATVAGADVKTVAELVNAVNRGKPGDTVTVAPGVYRLTAPLSPKRKMTIRGAGVGKTIIAAADSWNPGTDGLPKKENPDAHLFHFDKTPGVSISRMTLTGPKLHGAVFCNDSDGLELHHLRIENFLYCSLRTYRMDKFRVHDCEFIDAGGKFKHTGGALYLHYTRDSEFWNNRITKTSKHPSNFFGIKGRKAERCRIHHNTIEVSFSIEFPFEHDKSVEIDHNALAGVVSIPKFRGGMKIDKGHSFHIHHNWFRKSYAIEFARNGVEVNHNLFDFKTSDDKGNLISDFGRVIAPGPAKFHNNLIRNPGRGVFWSRSGYNNIEFANNHVKAATLTRKEGLFGFNKRTEFKSIVLRDNIIECTAKHPRPLMRNTESYAAVIRNNRLVNVSDTGKYANPQTSDKQGPLKPLKFRCGVNGEIVVDGWKASKVPGNSPTTRHIPE